MQDIINKIDERVSGLLAFERHDLVSSNVVLVGLLALHEDMALALRRIDFWQHTLEAWLKISGQSSTAGTDQENRRKSNPGADKLRSAEAEAIRG